MCITLTRINVLDVLNLLLYLWTRGALHVLGITHFSTWQLRTASSVHSSKSSTSSQKSANVLLLENTLQVRSALHVSTQSSSTLVTRHASTVQTSRFTTWSCNSAFPVPIHTHYSQATNVWNVQQTHTTTRRHCSVSRVHWAGSMTIN